MPRPNIEVARAGREAWIQRRIEAGELVPNAPFRERIEFLEAHELALHRYRPWDGDGSHPCVPASPRLPVVHN